MLTFIWRDIASGLELLNRDVRVFWEEDYVPVVVAHGRRATTAVVFQKSNKQLRGVWMRRKGVCCQKEEDYE